MATSMPPIRLSLALAVCTLFGGQALVQADNPKDQAALRLLKEANQTGQEKNFPAAVQRYRQFLSSHAERPETPAVRHALALVLLQLPNPDFAGSLEQLQMLADRKDLPVYPSVLYHTAIARRALGVRAKGQAAGAPTAEAAKLEASAKSHFEEAAKQFAASAEVFALRVAKAEPPKRTEDGRWAARARCDQVETLLMLHRPHEARTVAASMLKEPSQDEALSRLARFYRGVAAFQLRDYPAAGRDLSGARPLEDAFHDTHARFLLARVHQLLDERAEAVVHYEGVLADFEAHKKKAAQELRTPEVQRNPHERARRERLVRTPAPDHVGQAQFYLGILLAEAGRWNDAQGRLMAFLKENPKSPLSVEAHLRLGICQVNGGQGAAALRTLQPLTNLPSPLDDQAFFWTGKAHLGSVDPNNSAAYRQALARAAEAFDRAAQKADAATDSDGKARAAAARFELADVQQLLGQFKEAAALYQRLVAEKSLPGRDPELLQRLADALNQTGEYTASDQVCEQFEKRYPTNPLLPAVQFRSAENAAFRSQAAAKEPNRPAGELKQLEDETARRYELVIARFPEFEHANLARYGLGLIYYRRGELEKAANHLAAIMGPERQGELAAALYLHADCLIRLAPAKAEDAITAGKLREALQPAIEELEGFIGSQPKGSPLAADGLLRLGHCYQRLASLAGQPAEKTRLLQNARTAYKKIYADYPPQHQVQPFAVFNEARCFVQMNVPQRALTNLQRFGQNPLAASPIAPLAFLQLGNLLRGQNRPGEGAAVLNQCRERYGAMLLKDPSRRTWYPLIVLHQGICLKEAGKLPEARGLFEALLKETPDSTEASEAALRRGQCLRDEAMQRSEKARSQLATANQPEQISAAMKALADDLKLLREAAHYLETQAEQLKAKQPASETRARMLYDAAWVNRVLAEVEAKASGEPARLPPAEQKARALYQDLITAAAETPLSMDARFELAELSGRRGEHDAAVKLLQEILDAEPEPEMVEKARIRLGAGLAAKGDTKAAQVQFDVVAKSAKGQRAELARAQLKQLRDSKPLAALPLLGQPRSDRASLDDPTAAVSLAMEQTSPVPARSRPAPFLRLKLPDPYEFHYRVRMPAAPDQKTEG